MAQMPTWDGFLVYILRYLSDGAVRGLSEIRQGVMNLAELTGEQRAEQLPSGQSKADNRIGWAVSYLTRVGAIERPPRARYQTTPVGADLLASHPGGITANILKTMANPGDEWWLAKPSTVGPPPSVAEVEAERLDPMEQIEAGLARIHSDVAADLFNACKAGNHRSSKRQWSSYWWLWDTGGPTGLRQSPNNRTTAASMDSSTETHSVSTESISRQSAIPTARQCSAPKCRRSWGR
jgi:hypothetical protein